ncbi:triose-phosphate isomerase [Candidatus Woesearchaeota archaeon]|nr:triose-phosphate isomerase [Candidatus Woesearchaeota archaeon]
MKGLAAANLKMNLTGQQTLSLVKNYIKLIKKTKQDVVVCPSYTALPLVAPVIKKSRLQLGAQDVFYEQKGAFTGEISTDMLKELGCRFSIVGHSERRNYLKETDELVNLKVKWALKAGITPILCIGEDAYSRDGGESFSFVEKQLKACIAGVEKKNIHKVALAYEPIWALSTTANRRDITSREITQMHNYIRKILKDVYDVMAAAQVRILYGGSVNEQNISEILKAENVDGVLVGAASLDARKFARIVAAFDARK